MSATTTLSRAYTQTARRTSIVAAAVAALVRAFREVRRDVREMQAAAHHQYPFIGL